MKKVIFFVAALFFTVLAITFACLMIRGNTAINYVHILIPTIFGALCVKNYRKISRNEKNEDV